MIVLLFAWQVGSPPQAATVYWDTDGSTTGNNLDGTNLGGTGTWDTSLTNWWNLSSLAAWPNTNADRAIFTYAFPTLGIPALNTVTLSGGITANQLSFLRSGYTLTGGTSLTLAGTGAGLHANLGESAAIASKISGSDGLVKTGGGAIRLGNTGNNYTGTTTISNGTLIITGEGALGTGTSAIEVRAFNPNPTSSPANLNGVSSGSLMLDGTGGNITLTRNLSLQGRGPVGDTGAALVSLGNNTLSGTVDMGVPVGAVNVNTRMVAADGTLNISGPLNVLGTGATTISTLGGYNQAGASFYKVTGTLAGTGTLESSGGGTLFLNPSDSSGFSGTIRVGGSAAGGQNEVRISLPGVLGTRTASTTSAVLDLFGGTLAVLMDTPDVKVSNGTNANVYFRATSTIFADHTPGSSVKDRTVAFGNMSFEDNITLTFNSRNGYGMSFTTAPVNGGNEQTTITNNLQGGGLLSFTGNFWSNTDNGAARTMTIGGNGNTLINGSIIASAASFNHNFIKNGSGTLTVTGTASTLDGNITIGNGTLAVSDWRAVTNNTSAINIGATTVAGILSVVGNNVSQANLTTSKVMNLSGTTGSATILANQTGSSPGLIFNANFTASGAGSKTLQLGGTNTAANTINGAIVDNSGTNKTSVTKIDAGRWVLAGTNSYTGTTTISNGTLQVKANAAASTIINDASAITFAQVNNYAGGTLEFVGQASVSNVENLGALNYASGGAATVKLTPGSGGTASLIFADINTGASGTVNFVGGDFTSNKFTLAKINGSVGGDGIVTRSVFWNGADYAFRQGGVLRAPVYGVDSGTATSASALTASVNNEVTGDFSTNTITVPTIKFNGSRTLTINAAQTLTLNGAGVLATGGSSIITGGTALAISGTTPLVARVNGGADSLRIESTITGTVGITKSGAGTLVLAGPNTVTGTFLIAEGTVRLSGGLLGGSGALTMRQDGILELNGVTPNNVTAFANNGIVRNTSATTDVTLTVGASNGGGTSYGIIEDGGLAKVNVVKLGTGGQSWLGLSTYTGTTTIDSTGIVTINNLQNGGMASGIGASSNAASNLVFTGASATQAYAGLSYTGTTNDETDRLFTFNGGVNGGVRIQSNGVNHATSTWTNTGALAFGTNATGNAQGLVLGGASTGDNRFFPIINDNGAAATSLYKSDAGVWFLMATNGYSGATTLNAGTLYANDGSSLPTASNVVFNGGNLATSGAFSRTIGTGSGQMQWTAFGSGGFSAGGTPLTADFGNGNIWGSTTGFLGAGALLLNNSGVAKSDVDVISSFQITKGTVAALNVTTTASSATVTLSSGTTAGLTAGQVISGNANIPTGYYITAITGATTFTLNSSSGVTAGSAVATSVSGDGYRQINVGDFTSIGADFATISGVISGAGNLAKEGAGILNLRGLNSYTGQTLVRQGTLVVESFGNSTSPGATSVGDSTLGNTDAGAIALGNAGTTAGILQYVGIGETSDRKIRLNTTTGSTQIHADGAGPLILTNVANDMAAGAKLLYLRGTNAAGNMITSQLSDNGGALGVVVDGGATWILTNGANNYTGATTLNGGALGVGHDNALGGTGTLTLAASDFGGAIFAYGGDRTLANPVSENDNTGGVASFIGDYSLAFTGAWTNKTSSASARFTRNNIVSGKTLTINGDYTFTSVTSGTNWVFDGSGDTIINGIISNTQGTIGITYAGTGSLTLAGANSYNGATAVSNGTLRLGNNEVIPDGATKGNLAITSAAGATATLDLNGRTETVNGLTANSAGTAVIDNTSASAASFTFGANDQAVSFGGGVGTYTITDSGAGALSITKTGTAAATVSTGVTLSYQGATTVNGGTMTISSPLNGTTALNVRNSGSTLALTGGLAAPSAITGVAVENGATLNLLDGAGNKLGGLTTLQLGSTAGTLTTLKFNVGDVGVPGDELNTDTLTLLTGGTLNLFVGNQVRFDLTDAGLNASETYELLKFVDGGFTSGPLANTDYILGATPGGFSSIILTANNGSVFITTGTLITGTSYWRGLTDTTWNGAANNWSQDKAGATPALSIPGQGTDVIFQWDAASNAAVTTTLEQNFKINSLTFEASTTPANTPTSVTINPGVSLTNRLEVAPQVATDGIKITAGGPATVTISGPVRLGANQTWGVADSASVLSLGSLFNKADVTKTGLGKITLTAAADATFNGDDSTDITISAGTLEMTNVAALGDPANGNFATVTVNSTGAFYYNGAASSATNLAMALTLGGGTLSAGTATQTYSGTVNVSADSFINMAENNGPATNTARSITLSGVVGGSGNLTIDSNNGASGGNQYNGTLTLSNAGNTWNGDLIFNEGTVVLTNAASPNFTTNDVTFNAFGRFNLQGLNGATLTRTGTLTFAAGAIAELGVDNTGAVVNSDFIVDQNGAVVLGSAGTGASMRIYLSDAFSKLNITGGVTLGGNGSISVGGDAAGVATISSVISDGSSGYSLAVNDDAGGWAATNRTLRLTGLNTFTGNISLDAGILEFNTVTNISGGASALGNGTAITMNGGTLRFIGSSAQSTDRPITTATGAVTLSANGATAADTITYNGAITVGPIADGTQITLTGVTGREGIIGGGLTQTGDSADMVVSGGTWTHQTGTSRVGDDLTLTGAGTILNLSSGLFQVRDDFSVNSDSTLNLNGTGALSFNIGTDSTNASLQANSGGIINLGANDAVVATQFDLLLIGYSAGTGTLNMGTNNLTATALGLGSLGTGITGVINGTGTLTLNGNIDLYTGSISANLASTGTGTLNKIGVGTVTLSGDNSGLTSTGAAILQTGSLVLDYTTSNTTKLRAASALEVRGVNLTLNGNAGADTVQTVGSLNLDSTASDDTSGSAYITLNAGAGRQIVLNLNSVNRTLTNRDATIRFILPSGTQSATNGITTDALNAVGSGANAILGAWATVDDGSGIYFARNLTNAADGNIVSAVTTVQDSVSSWGSGENISDSTGFSGTLNTALVNSLRFNAAGGSDLILADTGVLGIASGGLLVTGGVGGTPSLVNGTIFSGSGPELIVTQASGQTFTLDADIRINHSFIKTGSGTLRLTGQNVYTDETEIQEGVLQVSGGSAIGDFSIVTLSNTRASTLELLADETIGRLAGGSRNTNLDLGTVDVGAHTLTINQVDGGTTYSGFFTGTGQIIKQGSSNLVLTNVSSGFTGILTVESGLLYLSGVGQINASTIRINKGGTFMIDELGTTRSGTRIPDTTTITLNSADGGYAASAVVRGLALRTDQGTTLDETVGTINFNTGASYLGMEATTADDNSDLIAANIVRLNNATMNVRGTNLGGNTPQENEFRIGDPANEAAFIATLVGGGGLAGSKNISIVPWAIGQSTPGALNATHMGNSLLTYTSPGGFRPLVLATEYNTIALAGTTDNARESLATDLTGIAGKTINALVLDNAATPLVNVTGTGAGQTLAVTSGAMLFTVTGATTNTAYSTVLGGFDSGITVGGTNEYVIHVVNPGTEVTFSGTSGATAIGSTRVTVVSTTGLQPGMAVFGNGIPVGATVASVTNATTFEMTLPAEGTTSSQTFRYSTLENLTATLSSPLNSTADITKSGRGTLIFTAVNTAGGGTKKTTINEGVLEIADLDNIGGNTGALAFAGGTLRLGASLTDDISLRTITLLDGGGTIDTNGVSLALANSVGSGLGGLTKVGLGNLTLNAAATYTGATTILGGTLTVGANNATGAGGDLKIGAGATLDLGANNITAGLVRVFGISPTISGTGAITASRGFVFTNAGDISVGAILAGAGGLFKNQTNVLTLTGLNTYTGTTEIQAGTLSINSIANVGGGASALGNPSTAENSIIRMGLTSTATTLQYTGSGHSSNRIIGMQGSTGSVTLDADGTGALAFTGGVRFENAGNKSLILRGSSAAAIDNTISGLTELGGVLTLNKADANTWLVNGGNAYTGATQIDNGVLKIGLTDALPTNTAVRLGTGTTAGTLDLNGFNQTIGSLTSQTNSNSATNQIIVDSGNTLTVNGAVTLGANVDNSITLINATGGGAFVNNNTGGTFQVGGATGTANENSVTADLSGLGSFTVNLGATGTFRIGDNSDNTGVGGSSQLTLAAANTITAGTIAVGADDLNSLQQLHLGSSNNLLNANTLNVSGNIRGIGRLDFASSTGAMTLRAADGTGAAVMNVAAGSSSTASNFTGTVDFSGHSVDLLLSTLTMADRSAGVSPGNSATTATMTFDDGQLNATNVVLARRTGSGTGDATATLNLGDSAAPGMPVTNIGLLNMAVNTSAGGTVSADFNVTGGLVTLGAVNMANAGAGRTVTSTIDLTGGIVNTTGDIVRTGGAGTENATVTLDGATLDMTGKNIGTGAANVTLAAQSGTLKNLNELNGGGAFTKTTAGTLVMSGTNAYSGATNVTGGTLQVGDGVTGSLTGAGAVTVSNAGSKLSGSGSITGSTTIGSGTFLAPGVGDTDASNQTLAFANNVIIDNGGQVQLSISDNTQQLSAGDMNALTTALTNGSYTNVAALFTSGELDAYKTTPPGNHDFVNITGTFSVNADGPTPLFKVLNRTGAPYTTATPAVGDVFNLMDWTGAMLFTGTNTSLNTVNFDFTAAGFSGEFAFDTSAFATHGIIVVVPEPSRALLLLLGLLGLFARRRRRSL